MLVTSNAEDTKKNVETFSNLLNKIVQSTTNNLKKRRVQSCQNMF